MRKGNLFVVSGPSGAGKGTLMARLREQVPDVWVSVSATTRDPRPGEQEGVSYFYLSDERFDELVAHDGFLEWAHVHGNRYGTLKETVLSAMAEGKQVILEIDVQGAFQVREKIPEAILVFIAPPSLEELRRRLEGRGTEPQDVIERRMATAEVELSRKEEYDVTFVNDDLDVATRQLVNYVNAKAEIE